MKSDKMIKDKISITMSILTLLGGYFAYEYMTKVNQSYALITIILIMAVALGIFSISTKGKSFWLFFSDVKSEFTKIYFPKFKEVLNGLFVVFIFCAFFMTLIAGMDSVFLNLYNSLM